MEVGKTRRGCKIFQITKYGGWNKRCIDGGILWKKLMHNSNKRGVEGGINKRGGWNFSKSVSMTSRLLER